MIWLAKQTRNLSKFAATPQGAIALFLVGFSIAFYVAFRNSHPTSFRGLPLSESYLTLLQSVTSGGYAKFKEDKLALKNHISAILANPANEDEESHASNIALYLFPELLPESNFEKSQAFELWANLEAEIEKKPRTPEARMFFEEMKSNIWNYENPRMTNTGLSPHAQETLKIYHELSSP